MTSFQRDQARAKANQVRAARAALHNEVRALPMEEGRGVLAAALSENPDFLATASVLDVLQWPLRTGTARAERFMVAARVGFSRRVGDLTDRQRMDLGRCLQGLERMVVREAEEREREMRAYGAAGLKRAA